MTIKEYYDSICRQISSLEKTKTERISAEKYLKPLRQLIISWRSIKATLEATQKPPAEINHIDIMITQLAIESGKDLLPRIKLKKNLRDLKHLIYPLTLNKNLDLLGYGLVTFEEKREFTLYNYLKNKINIAKGKVLILDGYISEDTLALLYGLPRNIIIRILTNKPDLNFITAWRKFNREYKQSEVRKHKDVYDRLVIVDNQSFMSGPSLKDAGKKPTLLCHFDTIDSKKAENFFEMFWKKGKKI